MPRTIVGSKTIRNCACFAASTVSTVSRRVGMTSSSIKPPSLSSRKASLSSASSSLSKSAAYVSMAFSGKPCSSRSFFTPSRPILSILSRLMNTSSKRFSGKPEQAAIAFKIRRSLILIWKFSNPSLPSVVVVARISSISARFVGSPIISISHCMNWRYLPFCGRSARHTFPICSALNGTGSSFS